MKISVIINNYNYGQYIGEAIEGVLAQSRSPDEIIVVDDGSTDNSREVIEGKLNGADNAIIIKKGNEGQLSCFNAGFLKSSGDILFFLDSDDLYYPGHLEKCVEVYEDCPEVDFVYTAQNILGDETLTERPYNCSKNHGMSILLTKFQGVYIGSNTSTLSMRRAVAAKILPAPDFLISDWRVRADDILVWGASLAGAEKYYLDNPTVGYRRHAKNLFLGKEERAKDSYCYLIRANQLINYFWNKFGYSDISRHLIYKEFKTIPKPTRKEVKKYYQLYSNFHLGLISKIDYYLRLWARHYRCFFGWE